MTCPLNQGDGGLPALRLDNQKTEFFKMKKKENRARDRRIYVRVSDNEYKTILRRSIKFQNLNTYMVQMALKGKVIERPATISLNQYLELNRIGNNINQIAKRINSSEANIFHKGTKKELEQALTDLAGLLRANTEALKELLK